MIILGIDPGSNTGISIVELDEVKYASVEVLHTERYTLDDISNNHRISSIGSNLDITPELQRCENLGYKLTEVMSIWHPKIVCIEDAYIHHTFAQAAIAIVTYVQYINNFMWSNYGIRILKIHNMAAKKNLHQGTISKSDIQHEVLANSRIHFNVPTTNMTEHEFDATSIAYAGASMLMNVLDK